MYLKTSEVHQNTQLEGWEAQKDKNIEIIGGRYGLGSKDTTAKDCKAVFDNLAKDQPQHPFTIGIVDDVTHLSLPVDRSFKVKTDATQCLFYGL